MTLPNTKETRMVKSVAASMAIENMFVDEEFILEMVKLARGEKTAEEIIEETIKLYARP